MGDFYQQNPDNGTQRNKINQGCRIRFEYNNLFFQSYMHVLVIRHQGEHNVIPGNIKPLDYQNPQMRTNH